MKIKSSICLFIITCLSGVSAYGHCQVPCGIYADQHRFEQMLEDQATIEKAGKLIAELSGKNDALSRNQLSRWVATKEAHATNVQKVIAEYFLAQRIKATAKNYEKQLVSAHSVIVASEPRVKGGASISNSHAPLPEGMDHRDISNLFVAGTRSRGIYGILPQPAGSERRKPGPEGCHSDAHPFHLGVMAYIDDVPPNGGGLRLWPGSHKRVFHTFERQHTSFRGEAYSEAMREVAAEIPAVDTYGPAGTGASFVSLVR